MCRDFLKYLFEKNTYFKTTVSFTFEGTHGNVTETDVSSGGCTSTSSMALQEDTGTNKSPKMCNSVLISPFTPFQGLFKNMFFDTVKLFFEHKSNHLMFLKTVFY